MQLGLVARSDREGAALAPVLPRDELQHGRSRTQQKQMYPRCERAASEHGDAWVVAIYDGDKLVELRRYERFGDDARAVERWNELVGERMKTTPASDDALCRRSRTTGLLQTGTRSVKAFDGEPGTVVGVYLLTPYPPDNANVLEQVTYASETNIPKTEDENPAIAAGLTSRFDARDLRARARAGRVVRAGAGDEARARQVGRRDAGAGRRAASRTSRC